MNVFSIPGGIKTDVATLLGMISNRTFQVLVVENDDLTKYTTCIMIEGVDGHVMVGEIYDNPKDALRQTREVVNQLSELTKRKAT
jgi:hypothetical protein